MHAADYTSAVSAVVDAARVRLPMAVSALAVHGVMTGALNREHGKRLNALDLVVPDGQPVRWALNGLYRQRLTDRVYGPRLMLLICEQAARLNLPVFLFGTTPEMLEALSCRLQNQFPDLSIAGTLASRFRRLSIDERDAVVREIRASGAAIVFVGIGCPRQEVWAYEMRERLGLPIVAVGAAFAFHAGMLAQAPPILQRFGLEWLYRLLAEPRRLWRRYLVLNPLYLGLLIAQWTGVRRFESPHCPMPLEELRYG